MKLCGTGTWKCGLRKKTTGGRPKCPALGYFSENANMHFQTFAVFFKKSYLVLHWVEHQLQNWAWRELGLRCRVSPVCDRTSLNCSREKTHSSAFKASEKTNQLSNRKQCTDVIKTLNWSRFAFPLNTWGTWWLFWGQQVRSRWIFPRETWNTPPDLQKTGQINTRPYCAGCIRTAMPLIDHYREAHVLLKGVIIIPSR